jgi:hypothetical protein
MKVKFDSSLAGVLCTAALLTAFTGVVFAQEFRGRLQGTVADPSEAAIAGASVTLRNVNTGVETVRQTDSSGRYIFDFVQPGTYSVTVQAAGFDKYVQENVTVLTAGDVTVNAALKVGGVTQTVEVTTEVSTVQFNTSTMSTTVQGTMVQDLPVLARNPFTLALLNPAVVNKYWDVAHRNPFYMWSNGGMDIGGPTGGKNEQLLDGTTLNVSARGSYNAPMDAVQEVAVQQNAMDSETGFSAGGTLNLSMKSGANGFHGTAYYFGRNPDLDALANRITRAPDIVRQNSWGGTLGNRIIKNKLFNFFAYEQWIQTQPSNKIETMPTAAEKTGDFSQALTPQGAMQVIYDPATTVFNTATGLATRQPFPGNIIPSNRIDPTAQKLMSYLWAPNNPGDDLSGVNNFKNTYPWWTHYWNMSDRADYNINDKVRFFARFSKFQTRLDNVNWGGTIAVPSDNGGIMDAMNAEADVLYMMNPRTTVDIRFGVIYAEDDYASGWAKVPTSVWSGLWPNSNWYTNVLQASQGIYFPNFNFSGNGSSYTGVGNWWQVHPRSYNPTVNLTHDKGIHHMKVGWQLRYSYDQDNASAGPGGININSIDTGSTFLSNYVASQSGNMWASALVGSVNTGSATINPSLDMRQQQWATYFQDDVKLSRNITLNLGLRWERETAPAEQNRMLVQTLNLTTPITQLQGITMPAQVTSLVQEACTAHVACLNQQFDGAMIYTNNQNPRMYDAPWDIFLPRAGIAIRVSDKTAIRTGYSRYSVPWVTIHPETGGLPTNGYSQTTQMLTPLDGVPRTQLSNPFPSTNSIVQPVGNLMGALQDLGNGITFWNGNQMKTPLNDRFNFTVQHQTTQHLFTEATFFTMFEHNAQDGSMWGGSTGYNLNQMNPMLSYTYQGLINQTVANPFYGLPATVMPGTLRTEQNVTVGQLLVPYPQYGALTQLGWPGQSDHYYALQLKAERPMANGIAFLVAYNYNQERHTAFFNDIATYNNQTTMMDRGMPRHNLTVASTYEFPIGKGHRYLNNLPRAVDAVVGGWASSSIFVFRSGDLLGGTSTGAFGAAQMVCNPTQNIPTGDYFNPACFQALPAYTIRTNPWFYSGLRGPIFWDIDATLAKTVSITERFKLELRLEAYNLTNTYMPADPDLGVGDGTMGRSVNVAGGNYGREIQYTAKIHF